MSKSSISHKDVFSLKLKRLLAALLAAATLVLAVPAASATSATPFYDVTDPALAERVEFLRLMGVVNGMGNGRFEPTGTFTRAQFVKMAICALNKADQEPAQRNRTIYRDVKPTSWANGYINLASVTKLGSGDDAAPLIRGMGDGTFQPDRAIKYGEAVAILCRMLEYGISDVLTGGKWYDGYLAAGKAAGLTDGLSLDGETVITRAQAANLFYNLYFAKPKGSEKTYLVTSGGAEADAGVVLSVDATAEDGTTGCFKTTTGTYKTDVAFSSALEGQEGSIILNADGKLVAFRKKAGTSDRTVTTTSVKSSQVVTSTGDKLTVDPDTVVYRNGETTTWETAYSKLSQISSITFHYGQSGKLAYLFVGGSTSAGKSSVLVARTAPRSGVNPFSSLAEGGSYTMYKNGLPATAADIRQYDVATWEPSARVIQVSDRKLTGLFEDAAPSPSDPVTVTLMGKKFDVLPAARDDLSAFKIGDRITLLLTVTNEVAGVVSANVVKGTPVGLASISGTTAKVTLLDGGLVLSGEVSSDRYDGQLVTVSSSAKNKLSLSAVSGSTVKGALDLSAGTLGDKTVAVNVVVYDRVKSGALVQVDYDTLPAKIAKEKISFALYDYADRVKCLVLEDATGDAYEYGYFYYTPSAGGDPIYDTDNTTIIGYTDTTPATLCVRQGSAADTETMTDKANFIGSVRNGVPGGIAYTSAGKISATVTLEAFTKVKSSAIDVDAMSVTVAGVAYPIYKDVQVYNKVIGAWMAPGEDGLKTAVAYSDVLNLYYDRSPDQGGKIRMVVIP